MGKKLLRIFFFFLNDGSPTFHKSFADISGHYGPRLHADFSAIGSIVPNKILIWCQYGPWHVHNPTCTDTHTRNNHCHQPPPLPNGRYRALSQFVFFFFFFFNGKAHMPYILRRFILLNHNPVRRNICPHNTVVYRYIHICNSFAIIDYHLKKSNQLVPTKTCCEPISCAWGGYF